jgi:hypothetical protein
MEMFMIYDITTQLLSLVSLVQTSGNCHIPLRRFAGTNRKMLHRRMSQFGTKRTWHSRSIDVRFRTRRPLAARHSSQARGEAGMIKHEAVFGGQGILTTQADYCWRCGGDEAAFGGVTVIRRVPRISFSALFRESSAWPIAVMAGAIWSNKRAPSAVVARLWLPRCSFYGSLARAAVH